METKIVKIGNKVIGGGNPILIQSMTNTKTENGADTVAQINQTISSPHRIFSKYLMQLSSSGKLSDRVKRVN